MDIKTKPNVLEYGLGIIMVGLFLTSLWFLLSQSGGGGVVKVDEDSLKTQVFFEDARSQFED